MEAQKGNNDRPCEIINKIKVGKTTSQPADYVVLYIALTASPA